ncbi:hypothetical protein [Phocaeicola plebeius]|uniref:hypothetical protein n=1 Tax=Phocaeicola plebeius TaxID=310297 RepID=UPI00307E18F9
MNNSIVVFIRKNWLSFILWFLNILSIFFILQIVFDVFPMFESKYSIKKVDRINSLVVDVSIGVITSTLFYILLVYIPEKRKSKTARNAQKINLQFLAEHMQFFILYLVKEYSLHVKKEDFKYSQIAFNEFAKVDYSIFTTESKHYPLYIRIKSSNSPILITIDEFGINKMHNMVTTFINKILSNPTIILEDEKLIDLLNEISCCELFHLLMLNKGKERIIGEHCESIFSTETLKNALIQYYKLYVHLLRYTSPNSFYINDNTTSVNNK